MLKRYLPFFGLQIFANILWMLWVLPALGETGSLLEMAAWLESQILMPVFLCLLINRHRRAGYWLTILYSVIFGLYATGMTGWSLMGVGIPYSVYVVCAILFVVSFGVFVLALKDLNIGQKTRRYDEIKD